MNKTVTINISGIIFHIEEDAYEKLSKYLSTIKGYFNATDGGGEIMGDIEARIAEMLQGRISPVKQVVLMSDVDFVIDNMGRPEDFAGEQSYEDNQQRTQRDMAYEGEPVKKRLFRDPDNKVLGGVCSGIGNYFDFDPVFLRIALALVTFFSFGSLIIVYIILWIAIPEARTTAEKLAMKGEKIDINNISRSVKEEAEQIKKRMEKYGNDVKDFAHNHKHIPQRGFDRFMAFLLEVLRGVGRVAVAVVGALMLIFGLVLLFALISSAFGFSMVINNAEFRQWVDMVIEGNDFTLGVIGTILFIGVPAVMITYAGIKLLFRIRYTNRWINLGAGLLWAVAWVLVFYVGARTGRDFSNNATLRQVVPLKAYDTLRLSLNPARMDADNYGAMIEDEKDEHFNSRNDRSYMIGHRDAERVLLGQVRLIVIKSPGDQPELVVEKMAKGLNHEAALNRARSINYSVVQNDSLLSFDRFFVAEHADKFRMQELKVVLKLPKNKVVYFDRNMEGMLYEVDNVSNTYNNDMVGRRWIMTDSGLKCIDCEGLDINTGSQDEIKDIRIDEDGIHIHGKHSELNADSAGLRMNSKTTHIRIDEHGLHVKKK